MERPGAFYALCSRVWGTGLSGGLAQKPQTKAGHRLPTGPPSDQKPVALEHAHCLPGFLISHWFFYGIQKALLMVKKSHPF